MSYTHTRQEVAELLGISTRSVDRYIKSGKLRSKKDGKMVYVNDDDVKNLGSIEKPVEVIENKKTVIVENKNQKPKEVKITKEVEVKTNFKTTALDAVYYDLREEIKEKNEIIQDLSMRLGQAEEIVKNSVSMLDFKRSQLLLEESKTHLGSAITDLKERNDELEAQVKSNKFTIWILAIFVVALLAIAGTLWIKGI